MNTLIKINPFSIITSKQRFIMENTQKQDTDTKNVKVFEQLNHIYDDTNDAVKQKH